MPFVVRPYPLPIQCPVTYDIGSLQGRGTVWNLSSTGWRLSGDPAHAYRGHRLADSHAPE